MQQSRRARQNPALEHAITLANEHKLPVLVFFGLCDSFPEANLRHYTFMLQGLEQVKADLHNRGITFVTRICHPPAGVLELAAAASSVVVDRGYLRLQREWRSEVADKCPCLIEQVEGDVVVPVETLSDHGEYGARTIRPKIQRNLDTYLVSCRTVTPIVREKIDTGWKPASPLALIDKLHIDRSVGPVERFKGGTSEALKRFKDFLDNKMERYAGERSHPEFDLTSELSPYLHFGQVSPVEIALNAGWQGKGAEAFIEQLLVRRELAVNFVYYNPHYDDYDCLDRWCKDTLEKHRADPREYLYTREQLENARTHDPYWNAAQQEMVKTGYMHNYMRMYWGKKILEWTADPREAYRTALYLNNKYELDGRDANGFTGVAWCFGKHDRPWTERPVFGKIRYMNARGLERKFDIHAYVEKVNTL
jgi:deoxyribodipyrimidine photo-lyase